MGNPNASKPATIAARSPRHALGSERSSSARQPSQPWASPQRLKAAAFSSPSNRVAPEVVLAHRKPCGLLTSHSLKC
eukprot:11084446-Alexandrium_andersonii.AAC.1